jgi:hypothetical protein
MSVPLAFPLFFDQLAIFPRPLSRFVEVLRKLEGRLVRESCNGLKLSRRSAESDELRVRWFGVEIERVRNAVNDDGLILRARRSAAVRERVEWKNAHRFSAQVKSDPSSLLLPTVGPTAPRQVEQPCKDALCQLEVNRPSPARC